jgi:hypothetical protein
VAGYAYGVSLCSGFSPSASCGGSHIASGARRFWTTSAATLLNPILLVYVPFALQEGVLMVCCLPLLFVWAARKTWTLHAAPRW